MNALVTKSVVQQAMSVLTSAAPSNLSENILWPTGQFARRIPSFLYRGIQARVRHLRPSNNLTSMLRTSLVRLAYFGES